MKIKRKFTIYNVIMLLTPIVLIGIISALMLTLFIVKYPVKELNIPRAAMLNPTVFSKAFGEFFKGNPGAVMILIVWFLICLALIIISTTIATRLMTKSIEKPMAELAGAAEQIRVGDLNFEVMGSDYDEINELCENFDAMRRELQTANERERVLKQERSMLLANISHDLKTPITSIRGYIDGIRDGIADTPEKMNRYIDTIYSKAKTIDDMVNNLSMFSRLEMSKLDFNFKNIDLNGFLRSFSDDIRLDLEKNNIELVTDISEEATPVRADTEKLRRVFSNLIDNAVKYGNSENPRIEIKSEPGAAGTYVYIIDNGIGIEESEIQNVFEGFYRVDSSRSIKGSGLGLGIVKQIVEKHDGKIWLKSDGLGKGTTAVIYMPAAKQ